MFNTVKKRMDETVNTNDIETIIGKNTCIKGELNGDGNVRIDGHIDGSISIMGNAVIGETGVVVGDVQSGNLVVTGIITGNANVKESLCIYSTGQLVGDVRVRMLKIDDGGVFKGKSDMAVKQDNVIKKPVEDKIKK